MTEQMSRSEALERITTPEMDEHFLNQEFEFVANKLDLTIPELSEIFNGENKTYSNYKNRRWAIEFGARAARILGVERRLFR